MSYIVKERSQYLKKASITGAERIVVSGTEYITPDQILNRADLRIGADIVYVDTAQALVNKTYNGYTLASACARGVATSLTSASDTLVPLSLLKNNYLSLQGGNITGTLTVASKAVLHKGNLYNARTTVISASSGGTTSNRYYGVESDSRGMMFVNVPWESGSGGSQASVSIPDLFGNFGSVAPTLVLRKGEYESGFRNFISVTHPATSELPTGWEFVLMVYSKSNNKLDPNGTGKRVRKKGWSVAMGELADLELVSSISSFEVINIREYMLRNYMILNGYTRASMRNMSYTQFQSTQVGNIRNGFGTSTTKPSKTKMFGIALRYPNPEFTNRVDTSRPLSIHCQSINGVPRYFYSKVAPIYAQLSSDATANHINFGFAR